MRFSLKRLPLVVVAPFQEFFKKSSAGGISIIGATIIALIWSNSPLADFYHSFITWHPALGTWHLALGTWNLEFGTWNLERFVNDGLMAIFFLLVGLEIKRELLVGELSSIKTATLPLIAACFGMIGPALIFSMFNIGTPQHTGWGIPVATDIAFALGALSVLGKRVPIGLKVFLAALAIADDLLAVAVIALFYSADISMQFLLAATAVLAFMYVLNRFGVSSSWIFLLLGVVVWTFVVNSGVHATIAGVLTASVIPARSSNKKLLGDDDPHNDSVLHRIEHGLQNLVAFLILPVFAFVNAGVEFNLEMMGKLSSPLSLGIILGLFFGKQLGIFGSVAISTKFGLASLPQQVNLKSIYGVSILCGIGFTMAIFIANLALVSPTDIDVAKISILIASVLSAAVGILILKNAIPNNTVRQKKS